MDPTGIAILATGVATLPIALPTPWHWRDAPASCGVMQPRGEGKYDLLIGRQIGSEEISITIDRRAYPRSYTLKGAVLEIEPGWKKEVDLEVGWGDASKIIRTVAVLDDPEVLAKLSKASAVAMFHKKIGTMRVPVTAGSVVVSALQECVDTRLRQWGMDPVAWAALPKPHPTSPSWTWLTPDDYPNAAIRDNLTGTVVAKLTVGSDGEVHDCQSLDPRVDKLLVDTTCEAATKRGRFSPATDASGQAISSYYIVTMSFQLRG